MFFFFVKGEKKGFGQNKKEILGWPGHDGFLWGC